MIETRCDENVPARAYGTRGLLDRVENPMNLNRRGYLPKSRDRTRGPARKLEQPPFRNGDLDPDPASGGEVVAVRVGTVRDGAIYERIEFF